MHEPTKCTPPPSTGSNKSIGDLLPRGGGGGGGGGGVLVAIDVH